MKSANVIPLRKAKVTEVLKPGATLRLTSSELVYAPGFVKWLQAMARSDMRRAKLILFETYSAITPRAVERILAGEYTEHGAHTLRMP